MPTFLLYFFLVIGDGESVDAIHPSNTAVISGNNFSFVCGTLFDGVILLWKFREENTLRELLLSNGTHVTEAFKDFAVVTTGKGFSTFAKNISNYADAGTYKCIEMASSDFVASISYAQLIVLGTFPICKVSKENIMDGEFLQMECIVNYIGSISPVIKWSRSDGINPDSHDNMSTVSSISSVVSKLTRQMTIEDNAVTFKSNIYFNRLSLSSDKTYIHKATNAPNYEFTWTHKPNVLYAPKSVEITQKKYIYFIGDILYCVANGNPSPSYEWTEFESRNVVSRRSSLTIDSTRMENHVYKCTATNDVYGKETKSISTTVAIHAVRRPSPGGKVYSYAPRNTVAVVGEPMMIHCKAISKQTSILWNFRKLDGVGEELISNRTWIHKPGFSVNNTEDGQFSLVKANTQLNDAGTYQCLNLQTGRSRPTQIATAQITVLLSRPECDTNASITDSSVIENDFLSLWCQFSYTGSMVPIIEWSRSDGRNSTVHNSNTSGVLYKSVTSRVTELMTSRDNAVRFECKIHFDRPSSTESQMGFTQATNAPDYANSWYYVSKVLSSDSSSTLPVIILTGCMTAGAFAAILFIC